MDTEPLYPFSDDADWLLRYCKLPLHVGRGSVARHGRRDGLFAQISRKFGQSGKTDGDSSGSHFAASFYVPVDGSCRIFLQWPDAERLNRDFGEGLTVIGEGPDGRFRLECPKYYIDATSEMRESPGWAVASAVNEAASITYGHPRTVDRVVATINNFDFEYGNVTNNGEGGRSRILRVDAAGTRVEFAWRRERLQLRRLVNAGLIRSASFVQFSFTAWPDASEAELSRFAQNVSSLCNVVTGQHIGIPILSFFDREGRIVRRTLREVVQSKVRDHNAFLVPHAEGGVPQLFRQSFEEHCRMQQSELWRTLPFVCASIEDSPYLEQKYSTLMAAIELLIRSSLIEHGHIGRDEAESKTLPDLIGMARGVLRWDLPKHYTEAERYRKIRNNVIHGGRLPDDVVKVHADFQKWKLLLYRRVFMRLGFDGQVASPQNGWSSSSPVETFAEEHNAFDR